MDPVALQILDEGLRKDEGVLRRATALARERLEDTSPGRLAAAGYELNRGYNILEKSFERICETFENHFEKSAGYHERLIERMELAIGGIRPPFLPEDSATRHSIREWKGFRHVFRHAYDLDLEPGRLAVIVARAEAIASEFPAWRANFVEAARAMHQW